jgi:hypothetical protein
VISGPPTPPPGTPGNSGNAQSPDPQPRPPSPGPPSPPAPGAPQGKRKRNPLPWLVAGVVAAVLAAICCLGGALFLFDRRTNPHLPERSPVPSLPAPSGQQVPSAGPSGSAGGGGPLA